MSQQLYRLRNRIHDYYRREESLCVIELIHEYQKRPPNRGRVAANARELVTAVRSQREGATGVDHLMHEFSLSSEEGVALMCVAEALLRIPDSSVKAVAARARVSLSSSLPTAVTMSSAQASTPPVMESRGMLTSAAP